jgi:hypothetical protein
MNPKSGTIHYAPYGPFANGVFSCGVATGGYTGSPAGVTCERCKKMSPGLWPEVALEQRPADRPAEKPVAPTDHHAAAKHLCEKIDALCARTGRGPLPFREVLLTEVPRLIEAAEAKARQEATAAERTGCASECDRIYREYGESVRACDCPAGHERLKNRAGGAGECAEAIRGRGRAGPKGPGIFIDGCMDETGGAS